ncbi:MAG TPA: glycosyltransferase [Phycisphaerales bacterium]|nr:glycosyltransferase [Phycisphaerales bacterium]HMP36630.1 glycosyltransferase [Phycisphaerales bacterium]
MTDSVPTTANPITAASAAEGLLPERALARSALERSAAAVGRTVVVVPCYNEQLRLDGDAFVDFVSGEAGRGIDFRFVDDGSTDGTAATLAALCARVPGRLSWQRLERNGGKAEAVRQGFLAAMALRPAPWAIGFFDADLATPLEALPTFVEILATRPDIEMVFGSRVNLLGRHVRRKLIRHWIGRIFATFASQMLGVPIYDTQCGAKLFRNGESLAALFAEAFVTRWIFDVEIIARLVRDRRGTAEPQPEEVIVELPLLRWEDKKGSKLRPRDFITVNFDLLRIRRRWLRGVPRRPERLP